MDNDKYEIKSCQISHNLSQKNCTEFIYHIHIQDVRMEQVEK